MYGWYMTFFAMYGIVVHFAPLCFAKQGVIAADRRPALLEETFTTERTFPDGKALFNLLDTQLPIIESKQPPVDTIKQARASQTTNDDEEAHLQLEDKSSNANISNTAVMQLLPSMLQHFCRRRQVCFEIKNMSGLGFPEERSCSSDCSQTGHCCFQELVPQSNTECIFNAFPTQPVWSIAYKMVTSEQNNAYTTYIMETCGEKIVAPWGSIYPVFSKSHKRIYKNKFCADAYGVIDGIQWNVFLTCPSSDAYEAMVYLLSRNKLSQLCMVYFEYPGDVTDLEDLVCVGGPDTICREGDFQIPPDIPFSHDEIFAACYSGLLSPYRVCEKAFANVFCAICRLGIGFEVGDCSASDGIVAKTTSTLVTLLDMSALGDISLGSTKQSSSQKLACVADSCRPILCPSGKVQNIAGECIFVDERWYKNVYMVPLQLTSAQLINTTEVFPEISGRKSTAALQSPWPPQWKIVQLNFEINSTGDHYMTDTLFVVFRQFIQTVKPKDLMHNIYLFKNKPWVIEMQHTKYTLEADFIKNRNFFRYLQGRTLAMQSDEVTTSITLPKWYPILDMDLFWGKLMFISEMHYCNRVEMLPTEYEFVESAIYNKLTGKFILNGFYQLLDLFQSSDVSVIVCLDYSGLILSNNNANYVSSVFFSIYAASFCFIVARL